MERINTILNTKITLGDCHHGEEFTNYFSLGTTNMKICAGDLKLTKEEISVVARSIKASFFHPSEEEIKENKLEEGYFSSYLEIDQDRLKKNLRDLYKKERLSHLLDTDFTVENFDESVHSKSNRFMFGAVEIAIVPNNNIILTREEMGFLCKSFKLGFEDGMITFTIDTDAMRRSFIAFYK